MPKYISKYGVQAAVEVARFEASQVYAVKQLVEKEQIDCDFVLTRACDATLHRGLAEETDRAFAEMVRAGVTDFKDVYHARKEDAERISGVKGAFSAFTFTAGHVWPYKLVMHLLKGVVGRGANLQTRTRVTKVSDQPLPDGRWLVQTDRGAIAARKVLFATNAYTADLAAQFRNHIVPVRGICSRIVVPKSQTQNQTQTQAQVQVHSDDDNNKDDGLTPSPSPAVTPTTPRLTHTYSIRHGPAMYDYLIPRLDGSIIVGGAKPSFWSDPSHWYNVKDDSRLIEPATSYFDGLMQRTFVGWDHSGAYTDKVWTGIMGYSSDFMPYIGHVPDKPGQMILAGFSGHGMPLILLSAKAVVQMLRHGTSFDDTGVPSLFRVTKERLANSKNEILADSHVTDTDSDDTVSRSKL